MHIVMEDRPVRLVHLSFSWHDGIFCYSKFFESARLPCSFIRWYAKCRYLLKGTHELLSKIILVSKDNELVVFTVKVRRYIYIPVDLQG